MEDHIEETQEEPKNGKKFLFIVLILFLVLLMIGIAATCIFIGSKLFGRGDESSSDTNGGGVGLYVDPNSGVYVPPEVEETELRGVRIPGWGAITVAANRTDIVVDFHNPEANADLYYLTFELRLLDDSEEGYEVLYTSGLVEPGLHLQQINLSRPLEEGTYDAVIHVQPYLIDNLDAQLNNADIKTTLTAK